MDFQMYLCKSDLEVKYLLKLNKDKCLRIVAETKQSEWKLKILTRIQQY